MTALDPVTAAVADALQKRISVALRVIRAAHPFFGSLALFAEYRADPSIAAAGTDGRVIRISADFAATLIKSEFEGLLVHELLHCALEHSARRKQRDPQFWNIAADIVANGMIRDAGHFTLPAGGIEMPEYAHLSVEEIYEKLLSDKPLLPELILHDLQEEPEDAGIAPDDEINRQHEHALSAHWRTARQQALTVARMNDADYGNTGLGAQRELDALDAPALPWRELLWQFVATTPTDFVGFDRRFLWQKLYLDAMDGQVVHLRIAIDTSGSIDSPLLKEFMSEILGILGAYPQISGQLYFADADLYGPYPLDHEVIERPPEGGGGTSFVPFFAAVAAEALNPPPVCVYFTDGYGDFPDAAPDCPVLWIVEPGGLDSFEFPFGEVARMGHT